MPSFDPELVTERPNLAAAQMSLYQARTQAIKSRRSSVQQVISQRTHMVSTLESRLKKAKRSYELMNQQVTKLSTLRDKGHFPKLQFIDRESETQVKQELSQALFRYDQLESDLDQSNLVLGNLVITASSDGVVQELAVNNIGQSIAPNREIMHLVPTGDTLIIEAKLSNDDISFVSLGQEARIKVATYNYIRYGTLAGEVARISPDAVEDEKTSKMLLKIWVRTQNNYMGVVPDRYPVSPGMTATVDLVTGKRTTFSFLTDKLRRTALGAFDER